MHIHILNIDINMKKIYKTEKVSVIKITTVIYSNLNRFMLKTVTFK